MEKNPQAVGRLARLLNNSEELLWAEEVAIPRKGMGCLTFVLVVASISTVVSLVEGSLSLFFFLFVTVGAAILYFKEPNFVTIGISKERIIVMHSDHNKIIPLKKVSDIQLEKGRGKDKADIRIRTKVKKLNTESYKFRIVEEEFLIEGVLDFKKVIDFMNQTHQKYLGQNPPDPNYIEIEE